MVLWATKGFIKEKKNWASYFSAGLQALLAEGIFQIRVKCFIDDAVS